MGKEYRLTKAVSLHGCSCKLPRTTLEQLLNEVGLIIEPKGELLSGPWEDAAVYKVNRNIALVETLDFFTPIIDEPEIQGQITACNVTNDIYAMAVTNILNALAILGIPPDMPLEIARRMLKGFLDFLRNLNVKLVGGQTIFNPWPIIGGCAIGIGNPRKIVYIRGAKPGDLLVLTKPLGIQPVMAAYRLMKDENGRRLLLSSVQEETIEEAITKAIWIMTETNKPVAEVMQQVKVNAATDITGFGLKGHATNMAKASHVNIRINRLPIIRGALLLSKVLGYPLVTGEANETAGGVLISVSKHKLDELLDSLERKKVSCFIIGTVDKGSGEVLLSKDLEIIEV